VEKGAGRDPSTENDTKKAMNGYSEPTEKGENPKERLGKLKPDLSLIPQSVLILEALAMMEGADKYGPYNWRKTKVQARTYIAATMRHLAAWLDGEEDAPDSGIHHLAHARASLGVLMDAQVSGMMVDDRVKGEAGRVLVENIRTIPKEEGVSAEIPGGGVIALFEAVSSPLGTRPTFYVSGPMRGLPDFNFPAFDDASERGRRLGYTIISPADMDRANGVDENTDPVEAESEIRVFVELDVGVLLHLKPEHGDGIALLPGWERSTGALAELFVARWLGLRVVSAITFREFQRGSPADMIAELVRSIDFDRRDITFTPPENRNE